MDVVWCRCIDNALPLEPSPCAADGLPARHHEQELDCAATPLEQLPERPMPVRVEQTGQGENRARRCDAGGSKRSAPLHPTSDSCVATRGCGSVIGRVTPIILSSDERAHPCRYRQGRVDWTKPEYRGGVKAHLVLLTASERACDDTIVAICAVTVVAVVRSLGTFILQWFGTTPMRDRGRCSTLRRRTGVTIGRRCRGTRSTFRILVSLRALVCSVSRYDATLTKRSREPRDTYINPQRMSNT